MFDQNSTILLEKLVIRIQCKMLIFHSYLEKDIQGYDKIPAKMRYFSLVNASTQFEKKLSNAF